MDLDRLQELLGHRFSDVALLRQALTHRSFGQPHNERLEFLGDSVLNCVVASVLYRHFARLDEGDLSRLRSNLVKQQALYEIAQRIGLGEHLLLGEGELRSGGLRRPSILADTLEAVIGAVYLERGIEAVRDALTPIFTPRIERATATDERYDAKNALQEEVVRFTGAAPRYTIAASGPDHDKRFLAEVLIGDLPFGAGSGRSKKEAEHNAARAALSRIEEEGWPEATEGGSDARAS